MAVAAIAKKLATLFNTTGGLLTAADKQSLAKNIATTTNDDAVAGGVGEFMAQTAGNTSLGATNTAVTIATLNLTPGDWDVSGVVNYATAGGITITVTLSSISLNNNTRGIPDSEVVTAYGAAGITGGSDPGHVTPTKRVSASVNPTPVYLVAQGGFSGGTLSARGTIRARRVR
jgi:hypothetical protein